MGCWLFVVLVVAAISGGFGAFRGCGFAVGCVWVLLLLA